MIVYEVDKAHYENIMKVLNGVQKDSKAILKKAINNTAKQARKSLASEAKETYAVKVSGFNKSMKLKSATVSNIEATIQSKGEALEIGKYKAQPFKVATGSNKPKQIKAKVLTESSMRALINGDTKAFVAKFRSNGHVAVVERDESRRMKSNPKKAFLKKLLSPSVPQMLGNEKNIFGKIEPEIDDLLTLNIKSELQRVMEGRL